MTFLRPLLVAAIALAAASTAALADPPDHAKAHGWRKKNDPNYAGYTGKKWENDYGIVSAGRCDTDKVLTAVGGVAGGIIGAKTSSAENRTVAIIAGTAIGAIIGNQIGRQIDRGDQACMGHALELGVNNKVVVWDNPRTGVAYRLTPVGDAGNGCRRFNLEANANGKRERGERIACRTGDGRWELRS